jgi:polysaccharide export outer membrane protein
MSYLNTLIRICGIPLAVGCLSIAMPTAFAADGYPGRDLYRINPGDVLQVSAWKEEDLQREVLVNPDGHFAFPLAGDMSAAGRTIEELRQELTEKLGRYIPEVVVTVAVIQLNGNKVYVIGQVNRPGEFTMNRATDVMQAISIAGGPTAFADLDQVKILRRGEEGSQVAIPFRYGDVAKGQKLDQNILLRAGDTVVVP